MIRTILVCISFIGVASCKPYSHTITVKDGSDKKPTIAGAAVMLYGKHSDLISTKYTDSLGMVTFDSILDRKIFFEVTKDGYIPNVGDWPTREYIHATKITYFLYKSPTDTIK